MSAEVDRRCAASARQKSLRGASPSGDGAPRRRRDQGAVLSALLFARPGAPAALPLLSFCLPTIDPGLMAEAPRRVGERAVPHAVGFQVSAATLGIAVLASAAGFVSERLGLEAIGWFLAAGTLVLLGLHERLVAVADREA